MISFKYFLKIELKTVNKSILAVYKNFLQNLLLKLNLLYKQFALPIKKKKFTLLRSPHVHKKSREQFQLIKYKHVYLFLSPIPNNFLKFLLINKPAEINMIIKKML